MSGETDRDTLAGNIDIYMFICFCILFSNQLVWRSYVSPPNRKRNTVCVPTFNASAATLVNEAVSRERYG